METPTNDVISSNTVHEFSWKDYWKVFFIVLGGGIAVFLATFVHVFFNDFNDVDRYSSIIFFVSSYFILIAPVVMGEALLALILSTKKILRGISFVFILHTLVYFLFPVFLLSIFWSGGDFLRQLPELIGTVGGVIFTAYGFIRTEHYRRKKFDKLFIPAPHETAFGSPIKILC